jgi:LytS/YehU family sensor histidine kinase
VITLLAGGAFGSALVIYADPVFILYQGRMAAIVIVVDSFLAVIVGLIVYNYERMRDEIESTYRELAANRVREERLRELAARSELKALKAQINPHFLFNALNSISALTTIDPEAAQGTLERLASIFRKTLLASEKGSVPLSSELELVDAYLDVERARFGDRLKVEQHVGPGAGDVNVLPLMLQPIVENAVRHGISPKVEGGTIRISASVDGGRLTVIVSDDGVGADTIDLSELSSESYGLRNVRDRLRTNFGPGEWLTVESERGVGTTARVTIPLTTEERSEA